MDNWINFNFEKSLFQKSLFQKSLYFNSLQKCKKKNHEWKIRIENHSLFQKKLYEKKIKGLLLINKLWILILRNDTTQKSFFISEETLPQFESSQKRKNKIKRIPLIHWNAPIIQRISILRKIKSSLLIYKNASTIE